jgi:hypothetical protein
MLIRYSKPRHSETNVSLSLSSKYQLHCYHSQLPFSQWLKFENKRESDASRGGHYVQGW